MINNQKKLQKKQQPSQVTNEPLYKEISDKDAQSLSGGCPPWWICPGGGGR